MKTLKPKKRAALGTSRKSSSVSRSASRKRVTPKAKPQRSASHSAPVAARVRVGNKGNEDRGGAPYQAAVKSFEVAVRAFQKQDYRKAAEFFEKLADIDARDIAERAQLHLRLCRQRLGKVAPVPKSAEEYYALGVAFINARDLERATEHLAKANKMKPNQDHTQYALAVSHALGGHADEAISHLEKAIAMRPENRYDARRDADFHSLINDARFRALVYSPGSH